jgi:hypothetical protein
MAALTDVIAQAYTGRERLPRLELQRRAMAADLPAEELARLDSLPEGEYSEDEVIEALNTLG